MGNKCLTCSCKDTGSEKVEDCDTEDLGGVVGK